MVSITALEFAYTQAPRTMKSIIQWRCFLLSVSVGQRYLPLRSIGLLRTPMVPRNCARRAAYYNFYAVPFHWRPSAIFAFLSPNFTIAKKPICKATSRLNEATAEKPSHPHETSPSHHQDTQGLQSAVRSSAPRAHEHFRCRTRLAIFLPTFPSARARICATRSRRRPRRGRAGPKRTAYNRGQIIYRLAE